MAIILPYPYPDPVTGEWDPFAMMRNLRELANPPMFRATAVRAIGDAGGEAGTVTLTGSDNTATARGAGRGTVLFADGTNRDSVGFITVYAGTTAYYVPVFTAN